jgi:hypothetical protein
MSHRCGDSGCGSLSPAWSWTNKVEEGKRPHNTAKARLVDVFLCLVPAPQRFVNFAALNCASIAIPRHPVEVVRTVSDLKFRNLIIQYTRYIKAKNRQATC